MVYAAASGTFRTPFRPELGRVGYRVVKRAFDVVFSGAVIAVAAVPSALLCLAIRLESPGNPIYSQIRMGRLDRDGTLHPFRMYKFRSMYADADERLEGLLDKNEVEGAMFKMRDDPRVTRIGRFIRRHSIDEFPQFVNVFLGQMSVVGPRPPLPREIPEYSEGDFRRLAVKPGLTGPWQVSGRSDLSFSEMVELDLGYIERRGFLYDLYLIARTIKIVFTGEGAA
ncbi:sugar transferase [Thermophilibacter sp.]